MALNIVARRKVSMEGFAEGWGDAYLLVKAMNEDERLEFGKKLDANMPDDESIPVLRDQVRDLLVGGKVVHTDDDGKSKLVDLTEDDFETVIEVLNVYWLQEVLLVASGNDRLKARI